MKAMLILLSKKLLDTLIITLTIKFVKYILEHLVGNHFDL